MKLYYSRGACSLVVRIVLNELNEAFEEESVDLSTKKTAEGDDYWLINPKGAVPALELDNGEVLTENQVIQQYLADKHQALLPPVNELKRYRTLEWLNFISTEIHKNFSAFFKPAIPDDIKNTVYSPLLKERFAFLNNHLENQDFVMGAQFSLPDAYLFVMLLWAKNMKIDLKEKKNLQAFFGRMMTRPAVQKSMEQEKLGG